MFDFSSGFPFVHSMFIIQKKFYLNSFFIFYLKKLSFDYKMFSKIKLLTIFKTLSFLICSFGFIWKVCDSFTTFGKADIGTKIELKVNF
jgi:hypothetical protein